MTDIKKSEGTAEEFPTYEEIEQRAYELYQKRRQDGRPDGYAIDDWLTAKEQLRQERGDGALLSSPRKSETVLQRKSAKAS